jgi:4-amino-4-deoxy-L-arabinose transferase-like glycosyltransferase
MADVRRFTWADVLLLLTVVAAAAGLRAGYLIVWADQGRQPGPLVVQGPGPILTDLPADTPMFGERPPSETAALAHNLKEHGWYGSLAPFAPAEEQTAHAAPGYPWVLSLLARFVPQDQLGTVIRWSQCGLGSVAAGLYFLFARRAFRSRLVAVLAGLLVAAWPFAIVNTAEIADGTLTSFLLALALFLGAEAGQTGGPIASLFYGLTLAALALVRATLLPFAFVALAWFLLRSRAESRGWLCALLAFLGFANGLGPWTVRNYTHFGEPVPVSDSAWLHLWIGNNPLATGGPATPRTWQQAPAAELAQIKSQPRRYARLGPLVQQEVLAHPGRTVQRRIRAGLYFLLGEQFFTDGRLADPTGIGEPPPWAGLALNAAVLGLFLLAALGWRWSAVRRRESMPAALAVIWLPLPFLLSHAESLRGPCLPLDGALLCFAAFALAGLIPILGDAVREPAAADRLGQDDES